MKKRIFIFIIFYLLLYSAFAKIYQIDKTHILYGDEVSYLYYVLNTETKEAMLGDGSSDNHNALFYPPIGDDWWNNQHNLWENVNVAESIEYNGETYTVNKVAHNAFYKTIDVKTIKLPNTIKEIGSYAFGFCVNLEDINIPEGVEGIKIGTFYCCKKIVSLRLPSTIESIGDESFIDCVMLENINIPGKCKYIGNDAFSWCLALRTLTIEDGSAPLEMGYAYEFGPMWQSYMEPSYYSKPFFRGLFNDCPLKNLYIGRNLKYDNTGNLQSPFESCTERSQSSGKPVYIRSGKSFNVVEFGDKVTEIHSKLFMDARIKNNITLPIGLKMVGNSAFYGAIKQSSITIPEECDSIGDCAFALGSLKILYCKSLNPPHIGSSFDIQGMVVFIPQGRRSAYKADKYWGKYIMCDAADEIIDVNLKYANSLYGKLSYLDLDPEDVSRLKVSGILGSDDWTIILKMKNLYDLDLSGVECDNISSISGILPQLIHFEFPQGLKEIKESQFNESHLMGVLRIPKSCEKIKENAFRKSSMISQLIIDGPTVVERLAFSFCTNLNEISISGGARLLEESFKYIMDVDDPNAGLRTLTIGENVSVEKNAFDECRNLLNIKFEGKVDSIANSAFSNCRNVKNIIFNGAISKLGYDVFNGMSISKLEINDLHSWCSMSFDSGLSNPISKAEKVYINGIDEFELAWPDDVDTIGDNVFFSYKGLKRISANGNVKKIGKNSFAYCQNLKDVVLSDNVETIGDGAFKGCRSLEVVQLPIGLALISDSLFYGCESLTDVTFPKSVKRINKNAFSDCI